MSAAFLFPFPTSPLVKHFPLLCSDICLWLRSLSIRTDTDFQVVGFWPLHSLSVFSLWVGMALNSFDPAAERSKLFTFGSTFSLDAWEGDFHKELTWRAFWSKQFGGGWINAQFIITTESLACSNPKGPEFLHYVLPPCHHVRCSSFLCIPILKH